MKFKRGGGENQEDAAPNVLHLDIEENPEDIAEIKIHILSHEICVLYIIAKMSFWRSVTKPSIRIEGIPGTCTILEENIPCKNYTLENSGDCARLECNMYSDSRRVNGDKTFLYPMEKLIRLKDTNASNLAMASTRRWGGGGKRRRTKRAPKRNRRHRRSHRNTK